MDLEPKKLHVEAVMGPTEAGLPGPESEVFAVCGV